MTDEEENTFRALKDQDLLATSKWCAWGFHKWTKWATDHSKRDFSFGALTGSEFIEQRRECIHCNLIKARILKIRVLSKQ